MSLLLCVPLLQFRKMSKMNPDIGACPFAADFRPSPSILFANTALASTEKTFSICSYQGLHPDYFSCCVLFWCIPVCPSDAALHVSGTADSLDFPPWPMIFHTCSQMDRPKLTALSTLWQTMLKKHTVWPSLILHWYCLRMDFGMGQITQNGFHRETIALGTVQGYVFFKKISEQLAQCQPHTVFSSFLTFVAHPMYTRLEHTDWKMAKKEAPLYAFKCCIHECCAPWCYLWAALLPCALLCTAVTRVHARSHAHEIPMQPYRQSHWVLLWHVLA